MRSLLGTLVIITVLAFPAAAATDEPGRVGTGTQAVQATQPPTAAPSEPPPPPPAVRPDPSAAQPMSQQGQADGGQWVYTDQYGWVWMPYGDAYTYAPPDESAPSMYVYYPDAGWCWVMAPWLWGCGPAPYFGLLGWGGYGWYGHGLGFWCGFSPRYANWGWSGRAYWGGGRWNGVNRFSNGAGRSFRNAGGVRSAGSFRSPSGFRSSGGVRSSGGFFSRGGAVRSSGSFSSSGSVRGGGSFHGGGFHGGGHSGGHR